MCTSSCPRDLGEYSSGSHGDHKPETEERRRFTPTVRDEYVRMAWVHRIRLSVARLRRARRRRSRHTHGWDPIKCRKIVHDSWNRAGFFPRQQDLYLFSNTVAETRVGAHRCTCSCRRSQVQTPPPSHLTPMYGKDIREWDHPWHCACAALNRSTSSTNPDLISP